MPFNKGHTVNLGRKYSAIVIESRASKLRERKRGAPSDETRFKISQANKGQIAWNKGFTKETDERIRLGTEKILGSKHGNWKGGITTQNVMLRTSPEYRRWRTAVFQRDEYTCVWCKQRGGILNADHIKSFANYPELRLDIDNGRTLCIDCHKTTDGYAGKGTKQQVNEEKV